MKQLTNTQKSKVIKTEILLHGENSISIAAIFDILANDYKNHPMYNQAKKQALAFVENERKLKNRILSSNLMIDTTSVNKR